MSALVFWGAFFGGVIVLFVVAFNWERVLQLVVPRSLPILTSGSKVFSVELDSTGHVDALVYCGHRGWHDDLVHWLRRWERARGVVWQTDFRPEVWSMTAHQGRVIMRDKKGKLSAVDMKTGAVAWTKEIPGSIQKGPSVSDQDILYLFESGEWRRIRASDGETVAKGTLAKKADAEALFAGRPLTEEDRTHSFYLNPRQTTMFFPLSRAVAQGNKFVKVACDEAAFKEFALTLSLCEKLPSLEDEFELDVRDDGFILYRGEQEIPSEWSHSLVALREDEPSLNRVDWFGTACLLTTSYLKLKDSGETASAIWVVDFASRKILLQAGTKKMDSWVLTPQGRQPLAL